MEIDSQKYFSKKILGVRKINHEGNNLLYEVIFKKESFLLKVYSGANEDSWNRGKTEFQAFDYLWKKGFRNIPQPIKFYEEDNIAIYSYEKGKILKADEIGETEIILIADFLSELHNLDLEDKKNFKKERTACIRLLDYVNLLKTRFKRIKNDFSGDDELWKFLNEDVLNKINDLEQDLLNKIDKADLEKELLLNEQVLTPGDFGFHNFIMKNEGYVFIDFEYFGRDDPVKEVLNFLHHDKTREIKRELKNKFLDYYRKKVNPSKTFEKRLILLDELIGMNWVLIYLNVLSKGYLKRTNFSKEVIIDRIKKAKEKINDLSFFN